MHVFMCVWSSTTQVETHTTQAYRDVGNIGQTGSCVYIPSTQHVISQKTIHARPIPHKYLFFCWGTQLLQMLQSHTATMCIRCLTLPNLVQLCLLVVVHVHVCGFSCAPMHTHLYAQTTDALPCNTHLALELV